MRTSHLGILAKNDHDRLNDGNPTALKLYILLTLIGGHSESENQIQVRLPHVSALTCRQGAAASDLSPGLHPERILGRMKTKRPNGLYTADYSIQ